MAAAVEANPMNTLTGRSIMSHETFRLPNRLTALTVPFVALLLLPGCAHNPQGAPRTFASPNDAVQTLTVAVRADDIPQLLAIMGSDGEEIVSSGDEAADRIRRQRFLTLYDEKHSLVPEGDGRMTLVVGNADWPFPVPIVRQGSKWHFDSQAGVEEILNRRVGENELFTIQVCKAIGDAQQEYALKHPNGDGVREYARQFISDPGKRNGLYWLTAEGEDPSPLGELAASAAAEGYHRRTEGLTPYHGYYYRILTAQGPNAPDGALDYVVNGKMSLGYAVIAYPAEYGNSGVMTFIMGADGVVYQKNLGDDTAKVAAAITTFDPGEGWTKVP
jgi:hypothetical protein